MDWTVAGIIKASGQTMTWSTSVRLWNGYNQLSSRGQGGEGGDFSRSCSLEQVWIFNIWQPLASSDLLIGIILKGNLLTNVGWPN